MSSRLLRVIYRNTLHSSSSSCSSYRLQNKQCVSTLQNRSIFTTSHLDMSWVDKIKGVFTGKETSTDEQSTSSQSFTLLGFAEQMKTARKLGSFKQYLGGGSSDATMAALEKHEAIIRYLGGFDPSGENISTSQKQETAKKLNCTIQDVEGALSKFMWAKEAQKKMEKLKAEGKPMPKNLNEVQELMGSSPMDLARSNLLKTGQVSRNALCPCGSKKRYKRCCGKDGAVKQ